MGSDAQRQDTSLKLEFHRGNRTHRAASGRDTSLLQHQGFRPDAARCVRFPRWNTSLSGNISNDASHQGGPPPTLFVSRGWICLCPPPKFWQSLGISTFLPPPPRKNRSRAPAPITTGNYLNPLPRPPTARLAGELAG